MPKSALSRGDVVSCADGDLYLVWSVTMDVVHTIPSCRRRGTPIVVEMPETRSTEMFVLKDRRHFPVGEVVWAGRVHPGAVDAVAGALREQAQGARVA